MRVTRDGSDWAQAIGSADDNEEPGPHILTFEAAQARARVIALGGEPDSDNSVQGTLDRYETDLKTRGGDVTTPSGSAAILPKTWPKGPSEA